MKCLPDSIFIFNRRFGKQRQELCRRLAVHASRSDGEVGKPIERGAGSVQVPFTLPSDFDAQDFVRLQHFSIIPPMLETFLNSQL